MPGGALAIPEGMEAMTVSLDAPRAVAGAINAGDHVTIYSTFTGVPGKGLEKETSTIVLVPTAELLAVFRPVGNSTFGGEEQSAAEQLPGSLTVTLALTPEDSQRFVFSMETGTTWFGLLPPDENGQPMEPISFAQVVK